MDSPDDGGSHRKKARRDSKRQPPTFDQGSAVLNYSYIDRFGIIWLLLKRIKSYKVAD